MSHGLVQPSKGEYELKTNMIKTIAATAAVALPMLAIASGAHAAPTAQPFSAAIGASFLTSSNSRDVTEDTGIHVGLGYTLPGAGVTSGTPSIDLDYDNYSGHGNSANVYGLYLADRYYVTKNLTGSSFAPYIGGGIGAAYINGSGHGFSQNVTNFAGKIIVGVKLNQAFVEAAYALPGKDHGYDTSAINVSIGTHF